MEPSCCPGKSDYTTLNFSRTQLANYFMVPRSSLLTIFDPVCSQIVRLVEEQIQKVEDSDVGVKVR